MQRKWKTGQKVLYRNKVYRIGGETENVVSIIPYDDIDNNRAKHLLRKDFGKIKTL